MVSSDERKNLAQKINASEFFGTSAKYGENVEKAFKRFYFQVVSNKKKIRFYNS